MATMLLASVCAFAQSGNNEPLRGDVNGDGKVNIADVTELVNIILNKTTPTPQVTYYWYVGQTMPESMASAPTVDDTNFTNNKWHTVGTTLSNIGKLVTGGTAGQTWYVAVPKNKYQPTADDLVTPDTSWSDIGTIQIAGTDYTVFDTAIEYNRCPAYLKVINN